MRAIVLIAAFATVIVACSASKGYKSGDKCPDKVFSNDGCNSCVCNEDGHSATCTLIDCLNRKRRSTELKPPVFKNYKYGDKCPAPFFSDGCNTCVCKEDGFEAACTKKACIELQVFENYKRGDKCPAPFFSDGCNSCVCNEDGYTALCTLKECINF